MDSPLQQIDQYLATGEYSQAIKIYEQAIENEPGIKSNYWYLGLLLLLQGQEAEAQMTWLFAMSEGDTEEVKAWTKELVEVLEQEATRFAEKQDYQTAWLIRQHIQEINPNRINNLLNIIYLSIKAELFTEEESALPQLVSLLEGKGTKELDRDFFFTVLEQLLEYHPLHSDTLNLAKYSLTLANSFTETRQEVKRILFGQTSKIVTSLPPNQAVKFVELCNQLEPNTIPVLANLANLYQDTGEYLRGVKHAQNMLAVADLLEDKIAAHYLLVRGLMRAGGYWQEAEETYEHFKNLLAELISQNGQIREDHLVNLFGTVSFSNYFADAPQHNHSLRNKVSTYCQAGIQAHYTSEEAKFSFNSRQQNRENIRIGYLSGCLRRHSVGWISRWIFQHHNEEKFTVYGYSLEARKDNIQADIAQFVTLFRDVSQLKTVQEIAQQIYEDEIDILIDLDSLTSSGVCGVMALKPAPIQITWLGTDASGIPAVDYFVADPYVLPPSAQGYYTAKIWRLPNTYLAVDGFEIGVPTLRRDELGIAEDAVIYLSAQTGYKRHPHTARLQMKIIKEVPNSYFLIKGLADEESINRFFTQIAIEEGVEVERLRFLPKVASEEIHRANLGIADIVLDTYPYNGATTTLETLWMGIPLVTRVGEQFAARNSYTMLKNVGVEAGIAWSDEEYLEWGIRLGKDAALRQEVAWQLRRSRQISPLWNAKQFTKEMEKAYEQMWQQYNSST